MRVRRRTYAKGIALCAALLLTLRAPIAMADTAVHTSNFDFTHSGVVSSGAISLLGYYTNTVVTTPAAATLPQFNPTLGRLNSATIAMATTTNTYTVTPSGTLSVLTGGNANRRLEYRITAGSISDTKSNNVTNGGTALLLLLGAGSAEIGGSPVPASSAYSTLADRTQFTGIGTFSVALTATNMFEIFTVISVFNGAGLSGTGRYTGSITVTYDYTPWSLTGYVYRDADHDGFKGLTESGTGLTLYAKLVSQGAPSGPAIRAVSVNSSTGAYAIPTSLGSYQIVIDDNATLSDVTPLVPPRGWTATQASSLTRSFTLVSDLAGLDFGLIQAVALCGRVFADDGFTTGVANDGVFNGNEIGVSGMAVRLTDAGGTLIEAGTTLEGGAYCLYAPSTLAEGVTLRVIHDRPASYIATGGTVGNSAGTYSRSLNSISFVFSNIQNYANLNFGVVVTPTLSGNARETASPASVIWLSHRFQSTTVNQTTFTASIVFSPNIPAAPIVVYQDTNDNGQVDNGEPVVSSALSLSRTSTVTLLIKVTIPATAPAGASAQVQLRADTQFTNAAPALTFSLTTTDVVQITTSYGGALSLSKHVDRSTATPGATIVYTITFTNVGSTPIANLVIDDATPSYTTFISTTSISLPVGLGAMTVSAPAVSARGSLRWSFAGTLGPSATGTLEFRVRADL